MGFEEPPQKQSPTKGFSLGEIAHAPLTNRGKEGSSSLTEKLEQLKADPVTEQGETHDESTSRETVFETDLPSETNEQFSYGKETPNEDKVALDADDIVEHTPPAASYDDFETNEADNAQGQTPSSPGAEFDIDLVEQTIEGEVVWGKNKSELSDNGNVLEAQDVGVAERATANERYRALDPELDDMENVSDIEHSLDEMDTTLGVVAEQKAKEEKPETFDALLRVTALGLKSTETGVPSPGIHDFESRVRELLGGRELRSEESLALGRVYGETLEGSERHTVDNSEVVSRGNAVLPETPSHAVDEAVQPKPELTTEQHAFVEDLNRDIEEGITKNLQEADAQKAALSNPKNYTPEQIAKFERSRNEVVRIEQEFGAKEDEKGNLLFVEPDPEKDKARGKVRYIFERAQDRAAKEGVVVDYEKPKSADTTEAPPTPQPETSPTLIVEKDAAVVQELDAKEKTPEPVKDQPSVHAEEGAGLTTHEWHKNALKEIVRAQGGDHSDELLAIIDEAFEAGRNGEGDEAAFLERAQAASGTDGFAATRRGLVTRAFVMGRDDRAARERGELVIEPPIPNVEENATAASAKEPSVPAYPQEETVAEDAHIVAGETNETLETPADGQKDTPAVTNNSVTQPIAQVEVINAAAVEQALSPEARTTPEPMKEGAVAEPVPVPSEGNEVAQSQGEAAEPAEDSQKEGFTRRMAGFGNRVSTKTLGEQEQLVQGRRVAGFGRPLDEAQTQEHGSEPPERKSAQDLVNELVAETARRRTPGFGQPAVRPEDVQAGNEAFLQSLAEAYPDRDISKEELETARTNAEEALKSLPPKERKKIGIGFHNWGLYAKSWASRQCEEAIRTAGGTGEWADAWAHTYHKRYIEAEMEIARAQEERKKGGSGFGMGRSLGSAGFVASTAAKVARPLLAPFGFIPYRGLMMLSMATAKGSEVIREVNERRVANTTRIENADKAFDEAMALYAEAQSRVADGEVTKEALDEVYTESLPHELQERLNTLKPEDRTGWLERKIQGYVAKRVTNFNEKLEAVDTDEERRELTRKYSRMLNKYSRLIEDTGTVHTFALGVEKVEMASKFGIAALSIDTWLAGLRKTGAFDALGSFLGRANGVEASTVSGAQTGTSGVRSFGTRVAEGVNGVAGAVGRGFSAVAEKIGGLGEMGPRVVEEPWPLSGKIDRLGVWGAARATLDDPELAKTLGWTGESGRKTPSWGWREKTAGKLWAEYERRVLDDPAFRARMQKLGYSEDSQGLNAMMKRIERGGVRLNLKTKSLEVNAEYLPAGSVGSSPSAVQTPPQGAATVMTGEAAPRRFGPGVREAATIQEPPSVSTSHEAEQTVNAMRARVAAAESVPTPSRETVEAANERIEKIISDASGGSMMHYERSKAADALISKIKGGEITLDAWLDYYKSKMRLDQVSADLRRNYEDIFEGICKGNQVQFDKARAKFFNSFSGLVRPEYRRQ
jgi:hypothetical protein